MHASWLEKIIETEYGWCKLEIQRKDVAISNVIEIKALSADSIVLSLENLGSITDPIGKSVCSFAIIDTDQINYEDFFTPDATAFKVVVSTMVRGANSFTTRWSGFLTPDFFAENLSYRTPINLTARDNIGYLNDVDFDMPDSTVTVRQLIQAAFAKISDNYPMKLAFVSQKQTAEGVLAIDATISTALLREMSWYEAVETILHDLGLQMRWVDNNTIAVIDLSQIPEYYATQGFNFIGASGYREIAPAWRQLSQEQDYGLRENFFEGQITPQNITFAKEEVLTAGAPVFGGDYTTTIKYYTPNNWGRAGEMYTINPADFFNGKERFKGRIFYTGIQNNIVNYSRNYMSWRQPILHSNWPMLIKFNAYNAIMAPDSLLGLDLQNLVLYDDSEDKYQIGVKVNVLLHSGTTTYILKQNWEILSGNENTAIEFILPELTYNGAPQEEELSIEIGSIPYNGELELRIYGFFLNPKYDLNIAIAEGLAIKMVSYISEVAYTYDTNAIPTGQDSGVTINEQHNIKNSDDYTFGQVPDKSGGINAFAGGLYNPSGNELVGFQRNAGGENYNLLELVGREIIHFNRKNYNRLSGTIRNIDKEPLMFNRLFVREGKKYAPYNYSLNVIANEMSITSMQEVEPYETASFTQIESEVTTGGGTVGGGNNTVLQYSEKPGNAKRIYELDTASDAEKNDGYFILDSPSFGEAKKVHISEVKDAELRDDFNALEKEVEAITSMLGDDTEGVIDTWNEVVNFLNGYKESDNLASILSGMQRDFLTLQDNVGVIVTNLSNLSVKVNDIDERVIALEELGLSLVVKDGKTYVRSKYDFYSDGGLTSGGIGSGGGGGTGGGSNVTYKGELSSGMLLGTITIDGLANKIYGPSALSQLTNDVGYVTASALDGYLPLSGGTIKGTSTNYKFSPLWVDSSTLSAVGIDFLANSVAKGHTGWMDTLGMRLHNSNGKNGLAIKDDATPIYYTNDGATINTLIHSGNYSSYALPLNGGGTITRASSASLNIKRTGDNYDEPCISYQANDTIIGSIGIKTNVGPFYWDKTTVHAIIHSGNIGSQSVNYANGSNYTYQLGYSSVGNLTHTGLQYWFDWGENSITGYGGAYKYGLHIGSPDSNYYFQVGMSTAYNGLYGRFKNGGTWGSWREIAFTDSNVASATKLQTARTIWGQSFDGTGDVSGIFRSNPNSHGLTVEGLGDPWYGTKTYLTWDQAQTMGVCRVGTSYQYQGLSIGFSLGNAYNYGRVENFSYTDVLLIKPNGNVLIGTTSDNGVKLQVSTTEATGIHIDSTHEKEMGVRYAKNTVSKAWTGYHTTHGACFYNYTSKTHAGLLDDGIFRLNANSSSLTSLEFKSPTADLWQLSARYTTAENGLFNIYYTNGSTWTTVLSFNKNGNHTLTGNFYATGGMTSGKASDRRLKQNIMNLQRTNAVNVLRALRPVTFEWNATAYSLDQRNNGADVGFIADEYEGLIPNSGRAIWDKYRAIEYEKCIPHLVLGWQIHDDRFVIHENRFKTVEDRLAKAEGRIKELEEELKQYKTAA